MLTFKYPMKPMRVDKSIFQRKGGLENYILERKFDGFRCILIVDQKIKLFTRGKVPMEVPDNLVPQLEALHLKEGTILDGEIWTPTHRGGWRHNKQVRCQITFWDIIKDGIQDISGKPLRDRRECLEGIGWAQDSDIGITMPEKPTLEVCEYIEKIANDFRSGQNSRSGFIHGVVIKKWDSPRRDNAVRCVEHPDWMKIVFDGLTGYEPRA